MRRDADTGRCCQLADGRCTIHARYGEDFLSDSCYFYPRLMQAIGDEYRLSGAMSCPEMLRLILTLPTPFMLEETTSARPIAPRHTCDTAGYSTPQMHACLDQCMAIAQDENAAPEAIMAQLLSIAGVAEVVPQPRSGDAHALFYALALTEAFATPNISLRLGAVMQGMAEALDCTFDRAARNIHFGVQASTAPARLQHRWQMDACRALAPALRRWIQAQVAMMAFPFGGPTGITMAERAAVLAQRFATVRLALMCYVPASGIAPDEATVIHVMQGVSRFMDHLADMKLTMMIHRDSGWTDPARLRGLVSRATQGN